MPWKSAKQAAWGHSAAGMKALGGKAKVAEWDAATPKGVLGGKKPRNKGMKLSSLMRASKSGY